MSARVHRVVAAPAPRAQRLVWPGVLAWIWFLLQMGLINLADSASDILRGNLLPASPATAEHDAARVVDLEKAGGFFLEPSWQTFLHQPHVVAGVTFTWPLIVGFANHIYAICQYVVPVLVGAWIFGRHRSWFGLFRTAFIGAIVVATVVYYVFPTAPPWLTHGITFGGHPYQFPNTMQHTLGGPILNGRPIADNPYAAMPSLHMSFALIIMVAVIALTRNPLTRVLAALYPGLILFAVVTTSNHWLLDTMAAVPTVACAFLIAFGVRATVRARHMPRLASSLPGVEPPWEPSP